MMADLLQRIENATRRMEHTSWGKPALSRKYGPDEVEWAERIADKPAGQWIPDAVNLPKGSDLFAVNLTDNAQWAYNANRTTRPAKIAKPKAKRRHTGPDTKLLQMSEIAQLNARIVELEDKLAKCREMVR